MMKAMTMHLRPMHVRHFGVMRVTFRLTPAGDLPQSTSADRTKGGDIRAMAETLIFHKFFIVTILTSLAIGIAFGPEIRHTVARRRSSDDRSPDAAARDEQAA